MLVRDCKIIHERISSSGARWLWQQVRTTVARFDLTPKFIGHRLLPLTREHPKALLPVANKPVLDYVLSWLEDSGITGSYLYPGSRKVLTKIL